jgi:hypothetical protein
MVVLLIIIILIVLLCTTYDVFFLHQKSQSGVHILRSKYCTMFSVFPESWNFIVFNDGSSDIFIFSSGFVDKCSENKETAYRVVPGISLERDTVLEYTCLSDVETLKRFYFWNTKIEIIYLPKDRYSNVIDVINIMGHMGKLYKPNKGNGNLGNNYIYGNNDFRV